MKIITRFSGLSLQYIGIIKVDQGDNILGII